MNIEQALSIIEQVLNRVVMNKIEHIQAEAAFKLIKSELEYKNQDKNEPQTVDRDHYDKKGC